MKRPYRLTARFIESVREPGRFGDGRGGSGLSLLVKASRESVSKSWCQRLPANSQGKRDIGLGRFPEIGLTQARELAMRNWIKATDGGIIVTHVERRIPTFADAIDPAIALRSSAWKSPKTEKIFRSVLNSYAVPTIGRKLISEITAADVLAVLAPIWVDVPEQAKRTKESISTVMQWAMVEGHRGDNPVDKAILKALPKRGLKQHFKTLPFADVGAAMERVKGTEAHWSTKSAFEFICYTACRSGEVRQAVWNEIDLDCGTWTIPADKMKNAREHRVPLSGPAMGVLKEAKELTGGEGLVFPSQRGRVMTDSTISKLVRENGIKTTPHGVRSSFRDWAAEMTDVPKEISEYALAHIEGSASELSYRRTDFYAKRRQLMEAWGAYLKATN